MAPQFTQWTPKMPSTGFSAASHYSDVIISVMASQITGVSIIYSTVVKVQIEESIKAPRHWPLWGEFSGDFPVKGASNAENVSIWWRHRDTLQRKSVTTAHVYLQLPKDSEQFCVSIGNFTRSSLHHTVRVSLKIGMRMMLQHGDFWGFFY